MKWSRKEAEEEKSKEDSCGKEGSHGTVQEVVEIIPSCRIMVKITTIFGPALDLVHKYKMVQRMNKRRKRRACVKVLDLGRPKHHKRKF